MRRPVRGALLGAVLLVPAGACGSGLDDCPAARKERVRGPEAARLAAAEELTTTLVEAVAVGLYNNLGEFNPARGDYGTLTEERRLELGIPDPGALLNRDGEVDVSRDSNQDELTA